MPMNEAVVGTWWGEKTRPSAPFGLRGGDRFRPGAKGVARGKKPRIKILDDRQCNLRDRGSIPRTSTSLGPHSSKGEQGKNAGKSRSVHLWVCRQVACEQQHVIEAGCWLKMRSAEPLAPPWVPWGSLESPSPCQGEDREFKSRRDRQGWVLTRGGLV